MLVLLMLEWSHMTGSVQIEQRRWCVTVRAPPAPPLVVCLFSSELSYHNSCHFPSQSFAGKVEGLLWTGLINIWSGESRLTGQNWTLPERSKGRDGCQIGIWSFQVQIGNSNYEIFWFFVIFSKPRIVFFSGLTDFIMFISGHYK